MTESTFSQRQQTLASMNMVEIPEGDFLYGSSDSDANAQADEKPQRTIFLPTFHISRTPVTNKQWGVFLQESRYKPKKEEHDGDYLKHWKQGKCPEQLENHPVVNVSKFNADAFCSFYGLRLPTETEWEKAARGKDGRLYPWGNQPPEWWLCNFDNFHKGTTPVDSFPQGASPYGVQDCAGNVNEWTSSPYNSPSSSRFSLRGGSCFYDASNVRCANRNFRAPADCFCFIGFRPAQDT